MPHEFEGPRTAIVTGGARRIGGEISRALIADGWHVLVHFHHSREPAQRLAAEHERVRLVEAELADVNAASTIIGALDGMPPVRLLVNNASQFEHDGAGDFTPETWALHHEVNLRAPALLIQSFAALCGDGGGVVVNMLDAKLAHPNPDFFTYTLSKIGLAGLTELCARHYAARGIRVCGIAPSVTLVSGPQTRANFDKVHALNALRRGVTVEEIVTALRFIIDTPTLTGQVLTLDGGQRFLGLPRDVQFLEM